MENCGVNSLTFFPENGIVGMGRLSLIFSSLLREHKYVFSANKAKDFRKKGIHF